MSQLALVYESPAPNAVQHIIAIPIPEPQENQVQVKIHAAAVNPVDYKIFDYNFGVTTFPNILGSDAAGEVTKLGPGVTKFKVGDRIVFHGKTGDSIKAAFQQYAALDVDFAAKMPDGISYNSASTIAVAGAAAASALYDLSIGLTAPWNNAEGLYKGQSLVVIGGSSSVGLYAIQLAALSGFKVITTSSPKHFDYLKSLGATTVLDRSSTLASDITAAAGGQVTYVVDAVSLPATQSLAVEVLQPKGKLALLLAATETTQTTAKAKEIAVSNVFASSYTFAAFYKGFWAAIPSYLERGALKPNKTRVLSGGLAAWEEAYALLRAGKVSGEKLVLRPQETVA